MYIVRILQGLYYPRTLELLSLSTLLTALAANMQLTVCWASRLTSGLADKAANQGARKELTWKLTWEGDLPALGPVLAQFSTMFWDKFTIKTKIAYGGSTRC